MRMPGFEPGISQPQCEVLTTILHTPGEAGYRSQYLSHAKRALYHLSYIPIPHHATRNAQNTRLPRKTTNTNQSHQSHTPYHNLRQIATSHTHTLAHTRPAMRTPRCTPSTWTFFVRHGTSCFDRRATSAPGVLRARAARRNGPLAALAAGARDRVRVKRGMQHAIVADQHRTPEWQSGVAAEQSSHHPARREDEKTRRRDSKSIERVA
jgi:hypothetical protein